MYKVKCDGYPLLDLRDEKYILVNPKVKVETNTIGEGSFTIYKNHPYYGKLQKLKSVFEVADEIGVIFRGRMTENTRDFTNGKMVDLEGAMGFFNDSIVPSFNFPEDFLDDADYITESTSGNVVRFFLKWLVENHNSQVQDHQKFILGNVTVSDPNNYITRSDSNLLNTWEILKSKLFESSLGGYLCIRYESDGNYIDYLSEFTLTNTQDIEFGVNLLDLKHGEDANETYSAIIPVGAEIDVETEVAAADEEGTDDAGTATTTKKVKLSLESIEDGAVTDDIYKITLKNGLHALYSKSALEEYGWIVAPVSETTWEDVTEVNNLLSKGSEWLITQGMMWKDTVEITAVDLHLTDEEIRSFRIYRRINVKSQPHEIENSFDLTKLDIDLLNPQNTKITVGETKLTLTDQNNKEQSDNIHRIEEAIKDIEENRSETTEIKNQMVIQSTTLINTCEEIVMSAMETFIETGDFSEFKQTIESELKLLADQMNLKFTETTTQIENVNGDLQETNTTISKYFDFTIDGLVIKSGESAITLSIDNDMIIFKKNGVAFGWWDGENFHTGNIVVEVNERAQFGNFAFVPRSDGSLSFLKVDNKGGKSIIILTQPKNIQITAGETGTFSITASGNELTYQWQYSTNEGLTWNNAVTTETYSFSTTEDSQSFTLYVRCIVTDSDGDSVTSNEVKLYVTEKQNEEDSGGGDGGGEVESTIEITSHPASVTVEEGETATFSVVATGTELTYQWQYKTTNASTWYDVPSYNGSGQSSSYSIAGTSASNGNQYRCVVSDAYGTSKESNPATLTVNEAVTTYSITNNLTNASTSNSATSIEEGSTYSATITANGGYVLSSVIVTMGGTDVTSSVYSNGVITISSVTGNIVITANAIVSELKITQQPQNVIIAPNETATFTIIAETTLENATLTYNWQDQSPDSDPNDDSAWVSGVTTENEQGWNDSNGGLDGWKIRCIVSDGVNEVTSDIATITVNETSAYTNLVTTSKDSSGNVYNTTGYKHNYRLNSGGGEVSYTGAIISGFMPLENLSDVIRITGHDSGSTMVSGYNRAILYNSSFTKVGHYDLQSARAGVELSTNANGTHEIKLVMSDYTGMSGTTDGAVYIRVTIGVCSDPSTFIVTRNEEIV